MTTYTAGDQVHIINSTMGGTFIIEGKATIRRALDTANQYLVDFGDGMQVERFVDPAAQDDPAALVARLNDPTKA